MPLQISHRDYSAVGRPYFFNQNTTAARETHPPSLRNKALLHRLLPWTTSRVRTASWCRSAAYKIAIIVRIEPASSTPQETAGPHSPKKLGKAGGGGGGGSSSSSVECSARGTTGEDAGSGVAGGARATTGLSAGSPMAVGGATSASGVGTAAAAAATAAVAAASGGLSTAAAAAIVSPAQNLTQNALAATVTVAIPAAGSPATGGGSTIGSSIPAVTVVAHSPTSGSAAGKTVVEQVSRNVPRSVNYWCWWCRDQDSYQI
uniref:Uncharacterized protein n=1 Tax=Anopheles culicifacies TaxID=139723 RepID=A0A182MVS2_9DIPT